MLEEQLYYFIINFSNIYICDYFLCKILTKKARWYQLHFVVNTLTVIKILPNIINIIIDPKNNYKTTSNISNIYSNFHLCLHIYHLLLFKNLNKWDYFHHIIFAFLGIIPGMLFINTNQLLFHKISCAGLPGMIEYSSLVLYKHNYIKKINQKKINMILYIFLRLPLCMIGVIYNYISYINNYIEDPLLISIYVNMMLYLNGTIFTLLTCDSYYKEKENLYKLN